MIQTINHPRLAGCLVAIALALTLDNSCRAAALTWTGAASMNWNESASNWGGPLWNNATPDSAVFGAAGVGVVNLTTAITASSITFNTAGYTIASNALTLGGASPSITNNADATISSVLAGTAGLTKQGAAKLTLSGNNTFTGNVTVGDTSGGINGGSLKLTSSGALGTGTNTVYVRNGSTFVELDGSAGAISLPSGVGFLTSGTSLRNLAGSNTINGQVFMTTGAGNTTVSSDGDGVLTLAGAVTAGGGSRTLILAGTSTNGNRVSGVINNGSGTGVSVTKSGTGHWMLTAVNTYAAATAINAGILSLLTGGSCSNSAVILSAITNNSATLSIATTNLARQWTCVSLTTSNAGNGVTLDFDFGSLLPSTSVAPLRVLGAVDFAVTPAVTVTADANIGPVGARFPLMTWDSSSGTAPTNVTFITSNPTSGHLTVSNSALYLVIDSYTPTLTDSQLFAALNLDYPGLEMVKAFVLSNDYANARISLAAYLRSRTNVNWYYNWHQPTSAVSYNQSDANLTTNATFSFAGYTVTYPDGDVDWSYQPTPTSQFSSLMNRMNFWPNVGATYWGTGDEGYVQSWVRQLRDWVMDNPVPANSQSILAPWATIQVAERMRISWPDSFFRCVLSPSFADDDVILYLKSSIDNGRYLRQWSAGAAMNNNIDAWELAGMYCVGTVFPELNEAAEWRAYAATNMYVQETNQFYPDGVHKELSPRYHIGTLSFVSDIYNLASLNGRRSELPADYLTRMEKAFEFLLYQSAPTRLLPPFNDCGAANEDSRYYLTEGYGYFTNRTDFLWTSGGGTPPAKVSWNFPYAGYANMRSSWDSTANYLCFDAGPLGSSSHRHDDKLNVVLWAWGRELLFDSGGGSYESSIWRTWGTSSYSHNCVTVDGLDQEGGDGSISLTDPDYTSQSPVNLRWESDVYHDFAAGSYNRGFGNNYNDRRATQTRRVLFVKPDIYVVADTLIPANTSSHTYQARWHLLTTNAVYSPSTKVVTTTDVGSANVAVVPCLATGLTVTNISGQTSYAGPGTTNLSEILGWDQPNLTLADIKPAMTLLHTLSGTSTQHFLTVFLPLKPGATNPVATVSNPGLTSAQITLTDGRKLLVFADPNPTNGLKLTEILPGNITNRYVGAGYTPPEIAGLTNDFSLPLGAALGPLPFVVTDNSPIGTVAVTARSLNQSLVPDANLTLGGSGTNRTLSLVLTPNLYGSATIAVTALDPDGGTMSASFDVVVTPGLNTPPVATAFSTNTAKNVVKDFNLHDVAADVETVSSNLLFTVGSATNGTVTLLADGRTARFTPANNFAGMARFTYTVNDLGEDPRTLFHYGFEPPDDPSSGGVADWANLFRSGEVQTIGTGSAQLSNDAPAVLGRFSSQSIRLTESGDGNAAQVRRLISVYDFDVNRQSWTLACWIKRASYSNDDFIFHFGAGNGFGGDEELQLWCPAGQNRVGLYHYPTGRGFYSSSTVNAGQWNHVAVSFTPTTAGGDLAVYLNGAWVNTLTNLPLNIDQGYPLGLGGYAQTAASSRWFNGSLDEAVFYKAAMTGAEITRLATNAVLRFGGLKATNTVTIAVGAITPQISSAGMTNGIFHLQISGTTNFNYTVQASTNLITWSSLLTTNPPVTPFFWTDLSTTNYPRRFYRVLLSP